MINLIKKILRIKPKKFTVVDNLLPINFDLKCGAKALGRIIEWSGCGNDSCEHCGPMKHQVRGTKVNFKLPMPRPEPKPLPTEPALSKMAPRKVRKLKGGA